MINIYEQVDRNKRKSSIVLLGFYLFVILFSLVLSYLFEFSLLGLAAALCVVSISTFFSYYNSDKIILSISGAKPANNNEWPEFYSVAENIAMLSQIPIPKLYILEDTAMNAFATGRDPQHAAICCTTGLLQKLDRSELEAVVAHEMAHIVNYDVRLMTIVAIFVGSITLIVDWMFRARLLNSVRKNKSPISAVILVAGIIFLMLSPMIASLIQLAISRKREYVADATAVKFTRFPAGLESALRKLSLDTEKLEAANKATAHLFIHNPLQRGLKPAKGMAKLFSTHPPIEERIAALQAMQR